MTLKLLLDTSFILPSFGVDTGAEVKECLELLAKHEDSVHVHYSTFNLLEAIMVLLREARKGRISLSDAMEMALNGAIMVTTALSKINEPPLIYSKAIEFYSLGHRDLIDNLLYATAVVNNARFLTVDEELRKFIKAHALKDVTITPKELKAELEKL